MKRSLALLISAVFLTFAMGALAQDKAPLTLANTIPLPQLHEGDFDHFVVDVAGAGHMVAGDRNDAFNRAVIDFVGPVEG